jgi:hypothetical protein
MKSLQLKAGIVSSARIHGICVGVAYRYPAD